jgi:hypothetical protein
LDATEASATDVGCWVVALCGGSVTVAEHTWFCYKSQHGKQWCTLTASFGEKHAPDHLPPHLLPLL